MKARSILYLAFISAVMSSSALAQNSKVARDLTNYLTHVLTIDRTRDGPVDLTVTLVITNTIPHSIVKLVCRHRVLGQPDWLIDFVSVQTGNESDRLSGEVMAQLIADSAWVSGKVLMRDYLPDPVGTIHLEERNMPEFFTREIYRSLTSQMSRASGKAQPAYDKKLKRMLQTAYDENKTIQLIAKYLNERGFPNTHATHPELINVRRGLVGAAWSEIAHERAAGLQEGSATVIYDLP